jgi:hypothetical protein
MLCFVGTKCIGVVEAKRRNKNMSSHIDQGVTSSRSLQITLVEWDRTVERIEPLSPPKMTNGGSNTANGFLGLLLLHEPLADVLDVVENQPPDFDPGRTEAVRCETLQSADREI